MTDDVAKWLDERIILKVYRGSHAYGTHHTGSDVDIGGVCIPPKEYLYGFYSFEHYESKNYMRYPGYERTQLAADAVFFGLHKFVKLAFACNPNILETLYTDPGGIIHCNSLGRMLLENRRLFLTKQARYTFGNYALSQLRKLTNALNLDEAKAKVSTPDAVEKSFNNHAVRLEHQIARYFRKELLVCEDIQNIIYLRGELNLLNAQLAEMAQKRARTERIVSGGKNNDGSHADLIEKYGYDVKHAMHLVRLLRMGLEIITEGECRVLRPDSDYLLSIRYGKVPLDQVQGEADRLFRSLDEAYENSRLPDSPDIAKVNQLLLDITEAGFTDAAWQD